VEERNSGDPSNQPRYNQETPRMPLKGYV